MRIKIKRIIKAFVFGFGLVFVFPIGCISEYLENEEMTIIESIKEAYKIYKWL